MSKNPIGIFDSGIGGLSIWKEITSLLPHENTIYIADSVNAPYGRKSKSEIIELCCSCTDHLLDKGAKIIVVACNTATTNAIEFLRNKYDVPFIGIEPAIKPALLSTQTKTIGILATKGTLNSSLFESTKNSFGDNIEIIEQVGTGLVELIESNQIDSVEMEGLLHKYLSPMLERHIDHLVLGCSHYPFLTEKIKGIIGENISIIDSGEAVAKQTKNILLKNEILNSPPTKGEHQILSTSDNLKLLKKMLGSREDCKFSKK